MEISFAAVICAAGSSKRMGGVKKEYLPFEPSSPEKEPVTVLGAVVSAFASCSKISQIIIVVPPGSEKGEVVLPAGLDENDARISLVPGGKTRRASVYNALSIIDSSRVSHVLIHDGARPWIRRNLIERVMDAAVKYGAVIPALPLVETPKELRGPMVLMRESGAPAEPCARAVEAVEAVFIKRHLRRAELCTAQTPQGFKFPEILRAHEKAKEKEEKESFEYTDDAEVWGEFIGQVAVIPGESGNKKITYPEDLVVWKK